MDPDNLWPPHICCGTCASKINKLLHGSRPSIHFAVPMVWQKYHFKDCYFCLTNMTELLHSRRTVLSTRNYTRQYDHVHMTVSPFQSLQLTGPLVRKARRAFRQWTWSYNWYHVPGSRILSNNIKVTSSDHTTRA